jgi:enoyl-CoA hydratase/carnithine racemase
MSSPSDGQAATILVSRENHVVVLTLNRPQRRNAMTAAMVLELCEVLEQADADDDVRAIVVTGQGPAFSVGADLSGESKTFGGSQTPGVQSKYRDVGGRLALTVFALSTPIIAAINGDAVGIGVTMTLPMDIRLAATTARFRFPFVRRGIVPESCSSWFLPRIVGISRALEWTYGGAILSAEEAHSAGLVRSLYDQSDLLPAALDLANRLTNESSAVSVAATRRLMWNNLTTSHPVQAHRQESTLIHALGSGPDAIEGITAFLEKRPAQFAARPAVALAEFAEWWDIPPYEADDLT